MKARSAECKYQHPLTDEDLLNYEIRLHKQTGKGIVHPDDFQEVIVSEAIKKHFTKKYKVKNDK